MEINLKEVEEKEVIKYADIVLNLCKEHFAMRKKIGYKDYDNEINNYNHYNIIGNFKRRGTLYYFIVNNDNIIGTIASYEQNSEINNEPIIYIDSFYIYPEYRNKGFGKQTLMELKKKNPTKKIELHCLYGNDAEEFYEKIGAKKVKIVYSIQ